VGARFHRPMESCRWIHRSRAGVYRRGGGCGYPGFLHSVESSVDESGNRLWQGANLRSLGVKPQVEPFINGFVSFRSCVACCGYRCGLSACCGKPERMKSFYKNSIEADVVASSAPMSCSSIPTCARIAIYDGPAAAPRVEEVWADDTPAYIESLSARAYELARDQGGLVPYTVIREVAENFIHADFAEPVVSILDGGKTLRFADQGPGIADKSHAVLPGYTTARGEMKRYIRGVGSGLPIVRDYLSVSGGSLVIEDNLGSGAVVTIYTSPADRSAPPARPARWDTAAQPATRPKEPPSLDFSSAESGADYLPVAKPRLSTRQKQVLALVMETGSAGPSLVSRELGVGISTAYRDLASLEDLALITSDGGKRHLTTEGLSYLDALISGS